jgi:general nucleoside transport system permease protein
MDTELLASFLASTLRLATPLILAAMAGLLSFQVGLVNIALEGFMLTGAFTAVTIAYATGSSWVGVLLACLIGAGLGVLFALCVTRFKANLIITGLAINFLAAGATAYLLDAIYNTRGTFAPEELVNLGNVNIPIVSDIPLVGTILSGHSPLVYISWLIIPITGVFLYRTYLGTHIRAVGENLEAARTAGISVERMRFLALILGGLLCGLAGAHLSMGELALFRENMTNGRGFIALAAVYFAAGRPGWAAIACLLFGAFDALQFRLQAAASGVPPQFFQMLPYLMVVITLVIISARQELRKGAR